MIPNNPLISLQISQVDCTPSRSWENIVSVLTRACPQLSVILWSRRICRSHRLQKNKRRNYLVVVISFDERHRNGPQATFWKRYTLACLTLINPALTNPKNDCKGEPTWRWFRARNIISNDIRLNKIHFLKANSTFPRIIVWSHFGSNSEWIFNNNVRKNISGC